MSQKQPEDPLSQEMTKSAFVSKRQNPYAAVMNASTDLSKSQARPTEVELKAPQRTESMTTSTTSTTTNKPFATTSFANPFQVHGNQSPDNRNRTASFVNTNTSTPIDQSSYFMAAPQTDLESSVKSTRTMSNANPNAIRRAQPILFGQGGTVQTPVQPPPKKEALKGIYAFFRSEELPLNPKQKPPTDMPQGPESIPLFYKESYFGPGLDAVDHYMKRSTNSSDEKMYYRIVRMIFLAKLQLWDKMNLELEGIGNLDKMIFDPARQAYLPYHLRLLYALSPYFTAASHVPSKSHPHSGPRNQEDKTLERLFSLLSFCESFIQTSPYPQTELSEGEQISMQSLCDIEVSEQKWIARTFRVSLLILEILFAKNSVKLVSEFLKKVLEKFPDNAVLLAYEARLKMIQGEHTQAKSIFDTITMNLPQDEYLEFVAINTFIQISQQLNYTEAESMLLNIIEKYPHYANLATNNLFYIQFAQCRIKEAIETLENLIRKEPWNINEVIIFNLLTAYDFYCADSKERKKIINEIIDRYASEFNKAAVAHELKI